MKLKDQVCSLEFAKRLKELGIKQEGIFYWTNHYLSDADGLLDADDFIIISQNEWFRITENSLINEYKDIEIYCAFTVAELGEMLPMYLNQIFPIHSRRGGNQSKARFICGGQKDGGTWAMMEEADTEADARAKLLICLLEAKNATNPTKVG